MISHRIHLFTGECSSSTSPVELVTDARCCQCTACSRCQDARTDRTVAADAVMMQRCRVLVIDVNVIVVVAVVIGLPVPV